MGQAISNSKYKKLKLYECNPLKIDCSIKEKAITYFVLRNEKDACLNKGTLIINYNQLYKNNFSGIKNETYKIFDLYFVVIIYFKCIRT